MSKLNYRGLAVTERGPAGVRASAYTYTSYIGKVSSGFFQLRTLRMTLKVMQLKMAGSQKLFFALRLASLSLLRAAFFLFSPLFFLIWSAILYNLVRLRVLAVIELEDEFQINRYQLSTRWLHCVYLAL